MAFTVHPSRIHPSTALALSALEWLETRISPKKILDIGCGNGILSLSAVHLWDSRVLACDISEEALRDTNEHIRQFATDAPIETLRSDGLKHPSIAASGPFDLILANLLAQWQVQMATDIAAVLTPGGTVILSGILLWQEAGVREAMDTIGIDVIQSFNDNFWVCLIVRKPL